MNAGFDAMSFRFNERKAAAAAVVLLELEGGRMRYLRLIKLLYLAERESLHRFGRPIFGDRYVAMKHGPVTSTVLDLIKGRGDDGGPWHAQIDCEAYDAVVRRNVATDVLSEAEAALLKEASALFKTFDVWRLRDFTHTLPEWRDPGSSSFDILPEDILRALGKEEEEIEDVRANEVERAYFDGIFKAQT